ncbi:MAG: hypothetical protein KF802_00085 [Bdellovibrionaceae bacterium]|nr:hypothetical protein [Pseudobdellovibrionaceae bacterium]MBX3034768.1 hypothetical protein [Pseudobdellovibrionaceae bacterium]
MHVVNRTAAIVTMKQPFADWLNSLQEQGGVDWNEAALRTPHVILLPDNSLDDEEQTGEMISQYWSRIATAIFGEWVPDPEDWPSEFSAEQFFEWFQIDLLDSTVMDLVPEPLQRQSDASGVSH